VPDINNFIAGIAQILKSELPHLLKLIQGNQFDTIYHEHYSYLSLHVVRQICRKFSLDVVDVQEISTHGGSLRVWISHERNSVPSINVQSVLAAEKSAGLQSYLAYAGFQEKAEMAKTELLTFLIDAYKLGINVLGYGAAAKGNTLLNYCGIKADLLPMVADKAFSKQGKFLPGSHIPVISPDQLKAENPDSILVLPWNLIREIYVKVLLLKWRLM